MTKLLGWALAAFAVYYLLTNPDGAASFALHILDGLRSAANALSTFASHL
jgi:hypothetical protein